MTRKKLTIYRSKVRAINLSHLASHVTRSDHKQIIAGKAGDHHYPLLSYLSGKLKTIIIELGTHHGTSSLALSACDASRIITYDLVDLYGITPQPMNVDRRIGNIFTRNEAHYMLGAGMVFVDASHEGEFEWQVYDYLRRNDYNGLLLLDDIWWSDQMIDLWNKIDTKKYDLTDIGHGHGNGPKGNISGTGLVDFSNRILIKD